MNLNFRRITPEFALDTFDKTQLRPTIGCFGDGQYQACLFQAISIRQGGGYLTKWLTFIHLCLQLGPDYVIGAISAWDGQKRPSLPNRKQLGYDDVIAIRQAFEKREDIRIKKWMENKKAKVQIYNPPLNTQQNQEQSISA